MPSNHSGDLTPYEDELRQKIWRLCGAGHHVMPLRGKRPMIKNWNKDWTYAAAHWKAWPFSGVTGYGWRVLPGTLALDLDPPEDQSWPDLLRSTQDLFQCDLPLDHHQETRRGVHILFRLPSDWPASAMAKRLWSPAGDELPIDLRRAGAHQLVVYDDEFIVGTAQNLPLLPAALMDGLRRPKQKGAAPARSAVDATARWSLLTLEDAEDGVRNDLVYHHALQLTARRELDARSALELEVVAHALGLEDQEVRSTVESGVARGLQIRRTTEAWLAAVFDDKELCSSTAGRTVRRVAHRLAFTAQGQPEKTWIGMSTRQLAIDLSITPDTAAKALRRLQKRGHLDSRPGPAGQAKRYRLQFAQLPYSQAVGGDLDCPTNDKEPPTQQAARQVRAPEELVQHVAFHRQAGSLPQAVLDVMLELRGGPIGRQELLKRLPHISSSTVDRALSRGRQEGIVLKSGTRLFTLASDDLPALLDEHVAKYRLRDTAEPRQRMIEAQRASHSARLSAFQAIRQEARGDRERREA